MNQSVSACACVHAAPLQLVTALWMLLKELYGSVPRWISSSDCHRRCTEEDMEDFRILDFSISLGKV